MVKSIICATLAALASASIAGGYHADEVRSVPAPRWVVSQGLWWRSLDSKRFFAVLDADDSVVRVQVTMADFLEASNLEGAWKLPVELQGLYVGPAFIASKIRKAGELAAQAVGEGPMVSGDVGISRVAFDFEARPHSIRVVLLNLDTNAAAASSRSPGTCCYDLNGDSMVDDADFAIFIDCYDALISCSGYCDCVGEDCVVDDADFTEFVREYNDLICP